MSGECKGCTRCRLERVQDEPDVGRENVQDAPDAGIKNIQDVAGAGLQSVVHQMQGSEGLTRCTRYKFEEYTG